MTENSDARAPRLNGVRLDEPQNPPQGQSQTRPGGADTPRRPRAATGVKRPIPSRPDPETVARTATAKGGPNGAGSAAGRDAAGQDPASQSAAAGSAAGPDEPEERHEPDLSAVEPDGEPGAGPFEQEPAAGAGDGRPTPSRPRLDVVDTVGRLLGGGDWERRASRGLAFLRRRITGDYEIDEFGFDRELTENVLLGMFRPLYERYFRVETRGIEHVPEKGGVLIVANHSGTLPLDAIMTQVALADHHPAHRSLRMLAADVVFTMPFIGELARKAGHTLACNPDAERLLCAGEVVGVWPEGFKGIGKPFADRYRLQRFGRGGFVSAALRTGTPIVPTAIVGAEEIYPKIGDIKPLARLLGLPYVPVTPTFPWLGPFGLIPLPSKWYIAFGEPIDTSGYDPGAADDPMLVFNLTDQVRETIQDTLYRLLLQRRSVFF